MATAAIDVTACQQTLEDLAAEIVQEHTAARAGLEHARRAGELLIEAKQQVQHGEWLPWIKANVACVTRRMAQHYMRLARLWERIVERANAQCISLLELSINGALALLRKEADPDALADGGTDEEADQQDIEGVTPVSSYTRPIFLYYSGDEYAEFERLVKVLGGRYDTDDRSAVVLAALRELS